MKAIALVVGACPAVVEGVVLRVDEAEYQCGAVLILVLIVKIIVVYLYGEQIFSVWIFYFGKNTDVDIDLLAGTVNGV